MSRPFTALSDARTRFDGRRVARILDRFDDVGDGAQLPQRSNATCSPATSAYSIDASPESLCRSAGSTGVNDADCHQILGQFGEWSFVSR